MSEISDEITRRIKAMNSTELEKHIKNRPKLTPKQKRYTSWQKIKKIANK